MVSKKLKHGCSKEDEAKLAKNDISSQGIKNNKLLFLFYYP
jgi:hypothetical protein